MSEDLVNQLTLNFLISKSQLCKLNKKTKENISQQRQSEINEYSNRIKMLFADLLVCNAPNDLLYDVKSSFDIFIDKTIYYFKAHDDNIKLENERKDIIHNDIDFEKEERKFEKENYKIDRLLVEEEDERAEEEDERAEDEENENEEEDDEEDDEENF